MADGQVRIQIKADDKELRQAEGSMKKFTGSILAAKAVEQVFRAIAGSMDAAISRFDTLNQFPRVLEQMGFSAEEASNATERLSDGIQGLPTRLDEVVATTQRFATSFRDVDLATESTLALNNALLASGASTNQASNATDQYVKMMSSGKVEMDNWNTLSETMNYALSEVSAELGYSAENTWELYDALKSGDVTLRQFNDAMIEASNKTGGFADVALTSTEGIATSWSNIQTAIGSGVEGIIRAFDDVSKAVTGNSIAKNMDGIKVAVQRSFRAIQGAVRSATPVIEGVFNILNGGLGVAEKLDFALIGVASSFIALKVVRSVQSSIEGFRLTVAAVTKATDIYVASQGALVVSIQEAGTSAKVLGTIYAVLTGKISLASVATATFNKAIMAVKTTLGIWAVAIGAVVAIGVGLYKFLMRTTPEVEAMSEEMSGAAEATDELTDATENSTSAYDKQIESIGHQTQGTKNLVEETYALTQAEGLNSAQKKIIKENVEALNNSVDGLNLAYDEENNLLSQSVDSIMARVEAMEAEELMIAAQERQMEITRERAELELQLETNTRLLSEAQAENGELTGSHIGARKELSERTKELEEKNAELMFALEELGVVEEIITQQEIENAGKVAEAEEESKNRRINALSELQEHERTVYDAMQARTEELTQSHINNFSKIEENTELTMASVRESLEHNIEAMANWAENMETLSNKGVDEGMLEELRRLGPEGGPLVAELVNASDEELAEMEGLFAETGKQSKEMMFDELGIDPGDTIDGIPELIDGTATAWYEGINTSNISKALPEEIEKGRPDMVKAGEAVAEGAAEGIELGTPTAGIASMKMSKAIDKEFMDNLGINSPSRVFIEHGSDIVDGLVQGIDRNENKVIRTIRQLGQSMTQAMRTQLNTMNKVISSALTRSEKRASDASRQIAQNLRSGVGGASDAGRQMGIGFYNGLNSTRGAINSLARNIANSASNSIRSALRIQSPSKVTYGLGEYFGEGFIDGMDSMVRGVERAGSHLAESAIPRINPMNSFGQLGYATAGGINNNTRNMTIHIEKIENHSDSDIPRILEESAWIMDRERGRLDG